MSKEKDKQGKVIWREIVDFFKSSHVTLTGYVLAAMIAAIGVGWLSTELKFLLLGPQSTNEIHRITLVISGLMFVIIMLLSIIPLSEKRAQLSADPKAKNALKQIPSYGRRISLLLTLLLFTLLLDTGKDILQNIAKSAPYWVIIVGMVVLFVLFILALTISPQTSESGVKKLLKYFETPSDMWLAVVIFASGVAIACIPPLSALHYLWFAVLGGYLFLHQVRRHAVPTNMLAETEDVTPHRHLILFVSKLNTYQLSKKYELETDEHSERVKDFIKEITQDNNENLDFQTICFVLMKTFFRENKDGKNIRINDCNIWREHYSYHIENKITAPFLSEFIKDKPDEYKVDEKTLIEIISRYVESTLNEKDLPKFSNLIGVYDDALSYFGVDNPATKWRMLFVAMEQHQLKSNDKKTPQLITLITSDKGIDNSDGSNAQIDTLMALMALYLIYYNLRHTNIQLYKDDGTSPCITVTADYFLNTNSQWNRNFTQDKVQGKTLITQELVNRIQYHFPASPVQHTIEKNKLGADFYHFDSCMAAVQDSVTASGIEEWDTVVDFTSGNKVASMVATFMTTTTDIKAQYVDEAYHTKLFDLRYYDLAKLGG